MKYIVHINPENYRPIEAYNEVEAERVVQQLGARYGPGAVERVEVQDVVMSCAE